MAKANQVSFVFLSAVLMTLVSQVTTCPSGCYCRDDTADCYGKIPNMAGFQPETKKISIHDLNVREIPSGSFQNLRNLDILSIFNVDVKAIKSGAFKNLNNIKVLNLYSSVLGTIESDAFAEIQGVGNFAIYSSNITSLEPFAFNGIRDVKSFAMYANKIPTTRSVAFSGFHNINLMTIYSSAFELIQHNTFHDFQNLKQLTFYDNYVGDLQCNSLNTLKGEGINSRFYSNHLTCDCNLGWFVAEVVARPELYTQDTGNTCFSPAKHRGKQPSQILQEMTKCVADIKPCPETSEVVKTERQRLQADVTDTTRKTTSDDKETSDDGSGSETIFACNFFIITSVLMSMFL